MANFSPSNLVKAQAILKKIMTEAEMRSKTSAALMLGLKNNDALIPSHKLLRTREDRTVEVNILKRISRDTVAARTANHTGNRGDSFIITPTWSTYADTFSISIKQMDNNVFDFNQALAANIKNCVINIHEDIETAMIDYLMAQRTQVNAATKGGTFNTTTDAFEISADDRDRFYQRLKSMFRLNKYKGSFDVIADTLLYDEAEYLANQGNGNSVNSSFQFGKLNLVESIELEDATYPAGVVLAMPEGNFGVLPWIPKQNREGWGDGELNEVGKFMSMPDPMGSGMDFALSVYAQRADTSASNGNTQDVVLQFEISVDVAPILAPLSETDASVVYEVAQMQ